MLEDRTQAIAPDKKRMPMGRLLRSATLAAALGVLLTAVPAARAQYPGYCPPYPGVTYSPYYTPLYTPPTSPFYFAGASYSFYGPPSFATGNYGPSYQAPRFYNPRYPDAGPYFYTPTGPYTPGYYSYYYTPGWFRY
jgi:hypothetical protein